MDVYRMKHDMMVHRCSANGSRMHPWMFPRWSTDKFADGVQMIHGWYKDVFVDNPRMFSGI